MNPVSFPTQQQLRQGSVLATIAYALFLTSDPTLSNELSWDGLNYSRQDSQGTRGTITFGDDRLVGVFRDDDSPLAPWRYGAGYSLESFFIGIPASLMAFANDEALLYVLDDYQGSTRPIITAAFWSESQYLSGAKPWPEILANGAHLLEMELMQPNEAIASWRNRFGFSDAQIVLGRSLFQRKTTSPEVAVVLSTSEVNTLVSAGTNGLSESRELLEAIGIVLP